MAPKPEEIKKGGKTGKIEKAKSEEKKEEEIPDLRKEAFQLANYYFVFQGVILTAIYSSPTKHKCQYRWIPFSLSLVAGFLNLSALTVIAEKYKSILDEKDRELFNKGEPTSSIYARQNSLPLRRFGKTRFDLPGQVTGVEGAAPLVGARGPPEENSNLFPYVEGYI
ncbi:Uncharacterized protein Adt_49012 [Abeliophyllum distichum]|uniref:Transmembrane protein n=1 Tax=Abeliophyllum distichum TaxID=126358 RepID=A0ABD1NQ13_9LAMI